MFAFSPITFILFSFNLKLIIIWLLFFSHVFLIYSLWRMCTKLNWIWFFFLYLTTKVLHQHISDISYLSIKYEVEILLKSTLKKKKVKDSQNNGRYSESCKCKTCHQNVRYENYGDTDAIHESKKAKISQVKDQDSK